MEDPEFVAIMKKFDMDHYYLGTEDYAKYNAERFRKHRQAGSKIGIRQEVKADPAGKK